MSGSAPARGAGVGAFPVDWSPDGLPAGATVTVVLLRAADGGRTTALFYEPTKETRRAAFLMHPRVDFSHHYLIPPLLRRGVSVWAQNGRFVNNDLTLINERLLLDVAAGMGELAARDRDVTMIGNSGGASLACFYLQQAARPAADRLTRTPAGSSVDLTGPMPLPARLLLVAGHPGQGDWLSKAIDPAVIDENDPSRSDPALDVYNLHNGFGSSYDPAFVARYRVAQRERIERIDAAARELIDRRRAGERGAQVILVHRTDADPRCVDLALERSDRAVGSIFGPNPERSNFGFAGLGRLSTPDAWLSNWSVNATRAALRLTLPEVTVPVSHVAYTADQAVFPTDVEAARRDAPLLERSVDLVADHYGFGPDGARRIAAEPVASLVEDWGSAA
jgi:hypothetical protein